MLLSWFFTILPNFVVRKRKNCQKNCIFAPSYIKTNGKEETKEATGAAISLARAVYQTKGTDTGNRDVSSSLVYSKYYHPTPNMNR